MRRGGCLCGAIRYELAGEPLRSGLCHCPSCRKAGSAPAMSFAVFPAEALKFLQGEPKIFRSSPDVGRSFCGDCGSPLTYRSDAQPDLVSIMAGSLDQPDSVPPGYHLWASHKLGWVEFGDGLRVYPTTRSAGP